MWHRVAPVLSETHTVVVARPAWVRRQRPPAVDPSHRAYSKRSMAADQAGLMQQLGHSSTPVVGHDRGARVAHRLVLDHPDAVHEGGAARHRADPARLRRRRQGAGADLRPLVLPRAGERPARGADRRRGRALVAHQARPVVGTAARTSTRRRCGSTSAASTRPRSDASTEDYRAGATIDLRRRRRELGRGRPDRLSDAGPLGADGLVGRQVRRAGRLARVRR